ncbi:MAG: hypothetical protein AAF597_16290, partial [Bacteroidota bacterium]
VADGKSYMFDYLSKECKRRITLDNPELFFEFYKEFQCEDLSYSPLQDFFEKWIKIIHPTQ